ncbi:MAG: SPOR domain-containing protein [bacterium]
MAKDTEKKPPKEKKKRSRAAVILWSFTGVLVLLLGGVALMFFQFPEILEDILGKTLVQDIRDRIPVPALQDDAGSEQNIEKETAAADRKERKARRGDQGDRDGPDILGERSHQVKPGESLWGIAKMGELVDNAWEWRTILLQNADKIDYAFISAEDISEGKGAWMVMLPAGLELTVTQPLVSEYSGKMKGRKWIFQLAAVSEARVNKAISVVRILMRDGYYANLERFEQGDKVWYRIRSGFYDSEEAASETAEEIRERYLEENLFPHTPLIFRASSEERSGRGMVFGAQLANPWVIELARRDSHREALRDLHRVKGSGKLAYIWQTLDAPDGPYVYQVRIGFFGSEEEASDVFAGKNEGFWEDARSIRIESLVESLPGQPHKLGKISF